MVYITFPINFSPLKGVFEDFDLKVSILYSLLGSNIKISAREPSFNVPPGKLYFLHGLFRKDAY